MCFWGGGGTISLPAPLTTQEVHYIVFMERSLTRSGKSCSACWWVMKLPPGNGKWQSHDNMKLDALNVPIVAIYFFKHNILNILNIISQFPRKRNPVSFLPHLYVQIFLYVFRIISIFMLSKQNILNRMVASISGICFQLFTNVTSFFLPFTYTLAFLHFRII